MTLPQESIADSQIGEVINLMREYAHLPDADHVVFALAVAVGADLDGDPAWGMIVGPPSSLKSEAIRLVENRVNEQVDDLTPAALLSWTLGKNPRPTGILSRAGQHCFVSISDFSTVLSATEKQGEQGIYALLRRAHDGRVQRDLGNAKESLTWEGRLTLLAASTPKIDDFSVHADALGPRWLFCRLPNETASDRAQASRKAREHTDLDAVRPRVQEVAADLIAQAAGIARGAVLTEAMADAVDEAAMTCALGRASVPRNNYGKREIIGLPSIEGTGRLVKQLSLIGRGAIGLGLNDGNAAALVRRVALDSIPQPRRRVLEALATGEARSTADVSRVGGLTRTVARYALEEVEAIGIVRNDGPGGGEPSHGSRTAWGLAGDEAAAIARVVSDGAVTRKRDYPHTSPPFIGRPGFRVTDRNGAG